MDFEQQCRLMELPPELRQNIYAFVFAEPEPVVSFVEQRTVHRPRPHTDNELQTETKRQVRAQPPLPLIVSLNPQIFHDALPIYFRDTIFLFNVGGYDAGEVLRWKRLMLEEIDERQRSWRIKQFPRLNRAQRLARGGRESDWSENLLHHVRVRLEFEIWGRGHAHPAAFVDYHFTKGTRSCNLAMTGGALQVECTCRVGDETARALRGIADDNLFSALTEFLHKVVKDVWNDLDRRRCPLLVCTRCGKWQYQTRSMIGRLEEAVGKAQEYNEDG